MRIGLVGPKALTSGRPSETAMCIGPESLVTQIAARRMMAALTAAEGSFYRYAKLTQLNRQKEQGPTS